jgi:hypothetical protein
MVFAYSDTEDPKSNVIKDINSLIKNKTNWIYIH